MAENKGSSSSSSSRASSAHLRPTINPPPRTSLASLFTGGLSPGPMTLVSNFFSESDPESDCRSFSQLLAGAMTSPAEAALGHRPNFPAAPDKENDKVSGGYVDFRLKQNRPTGLMVAQSPQMFTVPPGLSPASLLDSPGWFSSDQEMLTTCAETESCSLHIHHARDLYGWRTTRQTELLANEQSGFAWQMGASGGIMRVSKRNKEMLRGRKTRGLYQLEGSVQTRGATTRYGSSEVWPDTSGATSVGCLEKSSEEGDKLCVQGTRDEVTTTRKVMYFAAHPSGVVWGTSKRRCGNFGVEAAYGMSHRQALAQVTDQALQAQSHMHNQSEFPSTLSAAPAGSLPQLPSFTSNLATHQQMPPSMPEPSIMEESSDLSHPDQRSQPSSLVVDKPADDGYNWRKYGQKQVKGSEYPRSYYKCTHPNCPVKKKVERSLDGQITEIIYKGQHNHQPPQPSKRAKDGGNPNGNLNNLGNSELGMEGRVGDLNKMKEGVPAYSFSMKNQESSQATPEHLQGSSDSEEVGDAETRVDERDEDEPEAKRRNTEVRISEPVSSHRTVAEPRIVVQTTSEVDLLDDGYRWRKYGQKIVKGNPYPRSYYKCTSQGCNVRKHVERAASDPKAVVTTYEGKHNHDVPATRNSSHNTANNSLSQLKPHSAVSDKHTSVREREFGKNDSQPTMLQRFKEELT
ncbi:WRKY DNA-binding protein 3 [Actinidia rufa]|uniref:WRKY DNA-binding protein 3 n=1 Tax=Actinidia rufa TaxID=165716 RepID=A0A7J0ESF9_9ERIC|nr:WRKY DNA-binding protein 3 [Actinidia rufa]